MYIAITTYNELVLLSKFLQNAVVATAILIKQDFKWHILWNIFLSVA